MSAPQPELLACPFCGSAFKVGQEPHDGHPVPGMFYIYHDYGPDGSAARKCRISVPGHFNTEAKAAAAWNTRATDPKAQALADALLLWRQYDDMDEADFAQVGPMLHYANAINATRAALAAWDAKP